MLAFGRRLWYSSHLKDALFECPFLLLFTIPWTAAALIAFLYVQSSLLIALFWTRSVWELLFNGIGSLLCFPWLLLSLKSAVGTVSSSKAILGNRGGCLKCIYGIRRSLEQWVPRKRGEAVKLVFVLMVWLLASSPFSILIGQFIDDSRVGLVSIYSLKTDLCIH